MKYPVQKSICPFAITSRFHDTVHFIILLLNFLLSGSSSNATKSQTAKYVTVYMFLFKVGL